MRKEQIGETASLRKDLFSASLNVKSVKEEVVEENKSSFRPR